MSNEPDSNTIQAIGKAPDSPEDLRAIREAKGISLRDIFERTRISAVNLEAIESGDFSKLPAPVSARTFIKTYARIIGVDSAPILNRYARYLEIRNAPKVAAETCESGDEPPKEIEEKEEPAPSTEASKKRWPLVLGFLVLAGAIAAALIFLSGEPPKPVPETVAPPPAAPRGEQAEISIPAPETVQGKTAQPPPSIGPPSPVKAKEPQTKQEMSSAVQSAPATDTAEKKSVRIPPKPSETSAAESIGKRRLVIEATEVTWLRIREDQNPSYQVMLYPGEKIERFAEEQFQLDIGNAAGVDISFEGKSMGRLGGPAEVVHLTLP
jgi:cytoskeletal protein RodZ